MYAYVVFLSGYNKYIYITEIVQVDICQNPQK